MRRLFSTIADRYDLITVLLSYGQDRRWKRRVARLADVRPGERALDLACGTGDIAFSVESRGAMVVALDITTRMVELAAAKARSRRARLSFVVGDMMALPFPDASFDLVTAGYGIRNVPDARGAIVEIARVLRPGGRLVSLDFNRPDGALLRRIYLAYLTVIGSTLGFILHRDPDTYRYIPESIRLYPGAGAIATMMRAHGFSGAEVVPLLGGLLAIHRATRR